MSYGFSLTVAASPHTLPLLPPLSLAFQPFTPSHPPRHPSIFLSPSRLYCTSADMFDPCTAFSDLRVTGCNLLSIFFAFTTLTRVYQSSLFLIALSSLQMAFIRFMIHDSLSSMCVCVCVWMWVREGEYGEGKEKERDKDWRRRGACRWHSWIMTISKIDSLYRVVYATFCVCVCVY